jgi:putative membrane protein
MGMAKEDDMSRRTMVICALSCALAALGQSARAADKDKPLSDRDFAFEAARGGIAEVRLGELAVDRASEPAVKRFGQRMINDHSRANRELMDLLRKKGWELPFSPKELSGKYKDTYDDLAKHSGADFDRAYMRCMVHDHEEDVAHFEKEAKNGDDADVKAFAGRVLPVVKEHLTMARDLAGKVGADKKGDKDR